MYFSPVGCIYIHSKTNLILEFFPNRSVPPWAASRCGTYMKVRGRFTSVNRRLLVLGRQKTFGVSFSHQRGFRACHSTARQRRFNDSSLKRRIPFLSANICMSISPGSVAPKVLSKRPRQVHCSRSRKFVECFMEFHEKFHERESPFHGISHALSETHRSWNF